MSTGMIIDGILGSEAIDSSGEVLDVEGADISDVEKGTLLLNWEHEPGEKGPSTLVGKVLAAKKIYTASDCDNDRQRMYWKEVQLPFIYGVMRLYDGAGHEEAKRIAAMIRDHVANDEMVVCRFSVEGSTLTKEDNRLKESVIRRVAVTVKPCNRTANSGLIEDPHAPPGFEKNHAKEPVKDLLDLDVTAKNEFDNPLFQRLGHSPVVQCNPVVEEGLTKALTAGVTSGAPGTLTGGAALQRENVGSVKDRAQRLVKEYADREKFDKAEFRAMAKHRLPEASDEFIDHFVNVAEDYHVKRSQLTKKETVAPAPAEAPAQPKPVAKVAKVKAPVVDEEDAAPIKIANGTIRGVPTQPVKMRGYKFDEEKGILHTPKGSFALYNPDKGFPVVENKAAKKPFYSGGALHVAPGTDLNTVPHNAPNPGFRDIFNSQPIEEFHSGKVMPNWMRVHEQTKAGILPEEVVMHSAMFSMMSPNTPVRPHELMYAHMADTFEDLGIDARDPDFKNARRHWLDKDRGTNYPRTAGEYFRGHKDVHLGNDSEGKGRKAGELMSFMLGENKFKNVQQYSKLHQTLVDMVKRHGVDSRGAAKELMALKQTQQLWKNKRGGVKSQAKKDGQALGLKDDFNDFTKQKEAEHIATNGPIDERRISQYRRKWRDMATQAGLKNHLEEHAERVAHEKVGDYTGTPVPGLAPKTGRFTFTMLGGGNTFVPDTHVIRHLFGMDPDKDGDTLAYLKSVVWNANNHHILEGIDRWYAKNHPAAQLMQNHPKWGEKFKDDPEQANFPAFWRHWCCIAPDERSRGIVNKSANEFSTHEPFWMGIDKFVNPVKKSEQDVDPNFIAKMISIHKQYEEQYGEIPAQMMFFHHLVPHLMEASAHRQKHDDISDFAKTTKLHSLEMALRKSIDDVKLAALSDPRVPTVHAVYAKIDGNEHRAGRFMLVNNELHHLEDYHGLISHLLPEGPMNMRTLATIHGMKMSPSLRISVEHPQTDQAGIPAPSAETLKSFVPPTMRPPSVFHYQRAGMDKAHTLECTGGKYMLDGNEISHDEVKTIISNTKTGAATLRHRDAGVMDQIRKMEAAFADLAKAADGTGAPAHQQDLMHAQDALAHVRRAVAAGLIPPEAEQALTRHIYEDPLMEGVGNKKAWTEFQAKNKPGVYFAGDGTDFSAINNAFGHGVGDDAVKSYGHAMRSAMEESGAGGKLFRSGGDETSAWFPSHEHAMKFSRSLHQKLDELPPIQGVHKLSMGMGLGPTPQHADKALYMAKEQKYLPGQEAIPARERKRAFKIGQAPNMAHSLMPGHEGAVPLHDQTAEAIHTTMHAPKPPATAAPATSAQAA